jgi:hypothetical protein
VSVKDTVIGTAKQIVAEIVGDGRLAEEGAHQTHAAPTDADGGLCRRESLFQTPSAYSETSMDENRFVTLLGHAALKVWSDLPRDAQERLFAAAVDDGVIANDLAEFLHDRHPRTAHPPKPARFA